MYRSSYSNTGAGVYQSNWLMNRMMIGRNGMRDPRINYLFYRQVAQTPGKDGPVDEVSLECSASWLLY